MLTDKEKLELARLQRKIEEAIKKTKIKTSRINDSRGSRVTIIDSNGTTEIPLNSAVFNKNNSIG